MKREEALWLVRDAAVRPGPTWLSNHEALADALIAAVAERDRQWRAWFDDLMRIGLPDAKVPIAPDCQPEPR